MTAREVSIVGLGRTPFGRLDPGYTGQRMGVDAARAALADAGLSWQDID
jgi:acetyl-CoA C-acetyltransferase